MHSRNILTWYMIFSNVQRRRQKPKRKWKEHGTPVPFIWRSAAYISTYATLYQLTIYSIGALSIKSRRTHTSTFAAIVLGAENSKGEYITSKYFVIHLITLHACSLYSSHAIHRFVEFRLSIICRKWLSSTSTAQNKSTPFGHWDRVV